MGKSPDAMMGAVSVSLAARTGRSLDEWVAVVQASGIDPLDQKAVRSWLRSEHGVPQNSQWAIADAAAGPTYTPLIEVARIAEEVVGRPLPGHVMRGGTLKAAKQRAAERAVA